MKLVFFFLVTFCVISFHSDEADAIDIQCEFESDDYGYGVKKGCEVLSVTLSSSEDREITSVNGDSEKTYDDVWWFWSHSNTFNNFPKNIKKFFPNAEVVWIDRAHTTTLTKSDMASLGSQLRRFSFYRNKIEVLEEGLFDENPNLEHIDLNNNQIKFVASGVFDKLPKLTTLRFINNPCHSDIAANDRASVLLIEQIEGKCQDLEAYEKFRNIYPITTTTTEMVKTEHELRIEELTAEVTLKDVQIEDLKKELAAIKPCDELHEVRDSLMSKFKEMEVKFEGKLDKMDLKLDTRDEKFEFLNATCTGLDYKLDALKCIRMP